MRHVWCECSVVADYLHHPQSHSGIEDHRPSVLVVLHADEEAAIQALLYCGEDHKSCAADVFTTGARSSCLADLQAGQGKTGCLCSIIEEESVLIEGRWQWFAQKAYFRPIDGLGGVVIAMRTR